MSTRIKLYSKSYGIIFVKLLIHSLINRAILRVTSSLAGPIVYSLSIIIANIIRYKSLGFAAFNVGLRREEIKGFLEVLIYLTLETAIYRKLGKNSLEVILIIALSRVIP